MNECVFLNIFTFLRPLYMLQFDHIQFSRIVCDQIASCILDFSALHFHKWRIKLYLIVNKPVQSVADSLVHC